MAITRKPHRSPAPAVDVDALISRGGSPTGAPTEETPSTAPTPSPILLRIPPDMFGKLDAVLKARPVKIPRHTWILEAIYEKLEKERCK